MQPRGYGTGQAVVTFVGTARATVAFGGPSRHRKGFHLMRAQSEVVPDLIPVLQVFKRLNVSKTKGWQLITNGQLETVKIGKKSYCTEFEVKDFLIRNVRKIDAANGVA
jgi:hypothetical protein